MSTMQQGDYVVYTLSISDIKPTHQQSISNALMRAGIPGTHQRQADDTRIDVPRLTTFWRGDEGETTWQRQVREAVQEANGKKKPTCKVAIHAEAWQPLAGYPRGEIEPAQEQQDRRKEGA